MKTIEITNKYYVRIQGKNYVACELAEKKNKETGEVTKVLVKPTYHVDFDSACKAIGKRMERDVLEQPDVHTLYDALEKLIALKEDFQEILDKQGERNTNKKIESPEGDGDSDIEEIPILEDDIDDKEQEES